MAKAAKPLDLTTKRRKKKAPQTYLSCPYEGCEKTFAKKLYLECHIRVHTREQPFECTQCIPPRKFSDKSNLKRHIQATHLKVKRFGCSYCGKHFAQSSNLKAHMMIHSGQKKFVCETCDKRFSRKDHLSYHSMKCAEKTKKRLSAKTGASKKVVQSTLNFPIQKKIRMRRKIKIETDSETVTTPITTTTTTTTTVTPTTTDENMEQEETVAVDEKTIEFLKLYTNEDQIVPDSVFEEYRITVIEVTEMKRENDVDTLFGDDDSNNNNNTPTTESQNSNNNNGTDTDQADQVVPLAPYLKLEAMSPEDELFYQDVAFNVTISQESEGVQQIREIYNYNNNNNNNHTGLVQENSPFLPFQNLLNSLPSLIPVAGQTLSQDLNFLTRYPNSSSQNQLNGNTNATPFTIFSPPTF